MKMETSKTSDASGAGLIARPDQREEMWIVGHYCAECYDKDGNLKWRDEFPNVVTTLGKNYLLNTTFRTSGTYTTATIYMGLKSTGTAVAGDTMASHASWTELNASASSGARQAIAFSAASGGVLSGTAAVAWSITGTATVAGCFIALDATSTNGNTTGTLYSAGDFTGGNRSVVNGDTLNVTYSTTLT